MSITFHCECCKKKVKAPDNAGGKYGNCPHCKHRCYIPLPVSEDEPELKLAPIDDEEEKQYHDMMRETYNLHTDILHQTKMPNDNEDDQAAEEIEEKDLAKHIIIYLRLMADGELEQAERRAKQIRQFSSEARSILKKMARAERPEPELMDIAPKVMLGLMKQLNSQL